MGAHSPASWQEGERKEQKGDSWSVKRVGGNLTIIRRAEKAQRTERVVFVAGGGRARANILNRAEILSREKKKVGKLGVFGRGV